MLPHCAARLSLRRLGNSRTRSITFGNPPQKPREDTLQINLQYPLSFLRALRASPCRPLLSHSLWSRRGGGCLLLCSNTQSVIRFLPYALTPHSQINIYTFLLGKYGECCINTNAQPTGEHEVHTSSCAHGPSIENWINLGLFHNSSEAIR